jgi:hypothetical protein
MEGEAFVIAFALRWPLQLRVFAAFEVQDHHLGGWVSWLKV